jgi:hypothetical protein
MFNINQYDSYSFVFDGVLSDEVNGVLNPHKDYMQKLFEELVNKNKSVYIFTKRWSEDDVYNRRSKFLPENKKQEYLAIKDFISKYPKISNNIVVYTAGNSYYSYISDNNNHCHFESSNYEKALFNTYRPSIKIININQENWKNEHDN